MASNSRREDEEGLMFTPKSPHFFKIVFDKSIEAGQLGIPRNFLKKYGNRLLMATSSSSSSSVGLLRVPSGEVWEVELWKSEGRIWFRKGWREFAKYYSLRQGHFLVFRYHEHTTTSAYSFHVSIFDKSAAEIDYPLNNVNPAYDDDDDDVKDSDSGSDSDRSLEILGEYDHDLAPCKRKRMEKSPMQYCCPRPRKKLKRRFNSTSKTDNLSKSSGLRGLGLESVKEKYTTTWRKGFGNYKANFDSQGAKISNQPRSRSRGGCKAGASKTVRGRVKKGLEWPEQAEILRVKSLTAEEKARAIGIANAFKSHNPFFLVVIKPAHLGKGTRFRMALPINFARNYLVEKLPLDEATLCLPNGKTWCVKYNLNGSTKRLKAQFGSGWKRFALDNNLKAGDVCVFELINGKGKGPNILLNVVIHPDQVNRPELWQGKLSGGRGRLAVSNLQKETSSK